jgi:hypothetical protein
MKCEEIQKNLIEKSLNELSDAELSHINNCDNCKHFYMLLDIDLQLRSDECWHQPSEFNLKILNQRLQNRPWQNVVPKRTLLNAISWAAAIVIIILALYISIFSQSEKIIDNNNDETHYYYTDVIFTNYLNDDEQ